MKAEQPASFGWDALHVGALACFAVGQPLLDLLARHPEFFGARRFSPREIVLMALAVTFAPLLAWASFAGLAARVGRPLYRGAHLLVLALLGGLFFAQLGKRLDRAADWPVYTCGLVGGVAFALAYRRFARARAVVSLLAAGLLLFPALFLAHPSIRPQLDPGPRLAARLAAPRTPAPVVVVIFDELGLDALMDESRQIDAIRYPSFAKLAATSTWFRGATTVSDQTAFAVPAILTGRYPRDERSPTYQEHPRNLFTALAGAYDLRAFETWTALCPPELCAPGEALAWRPRANRLAADLGVLYQHLVLPPSRVASLPPVSSTWSDFASPVRRGPEAFGQAPGERDPAAQFAEFLAAIEPTERPALFFLHTTLPHLPWQFLPSGRRYGLLDNWSLPHGALDDRWGTDRWESIQGMQRYLLQVGFADLLLGRLLDRLQSTGLFEQALIAVVADHGTSFRPGEPRRVATPANVDELAWIPLLIKRPGQREARLDEATVETIDLLPSIFDAIGLETGWELDGRSLFAAPPNRPRVRAFHSGRERTPFSPTAVGLERLLTERIEVFGARTPWERVYTIGPHADLVGREVASFAPLEPSRCVLDLEGGGALLAVTPGAAYVPSRVKGELRAEPTCPHRHLAIAVDGVIGAATRAHQEAGRVKFSAMLPESLFSSSDYRLELFMIQEGRNGAPRLMSTQRRAVAGYRLSPDGSSLLSAAGDVVPIDSRESAGAIDELELAGHTLAIGGWALNPVTRETRAEIVVALDGRVLFTGKTTIARPDLVVAGADDEPPRAGFRFRIPLPEGVAGKAPRVRAFAVSPRGVAAELAHFRMFDLLEGVAGPATLRRTWDRATIPVVEAAAEGRLDAVRFTADRVSIEGWAVDRSTGEPADEVVLFLDDRFLATTRPAEAITAASGPAAKTGLRGGFSADVFAGALGGSRQVRAFAVTRAGKASELPSAAQRRDD